MKILDELERLEKAASNPKNAKDQGTKIGQYHCAVLKKSRALLKIARAAKEFKKSIDRYGVTNFQAIGGLFNLSEALRELEKK